MERWKEEKGSLTVEASFVFPIVFFVLLAVIYMCFYQVDKNNAGTIVHQAAEELAVSIKEQKMDEKQLKEHNLFYFLKTPTDMQKQAKILAEEQLTKKLMMGNVENVSVEAGYTKVVVSATVSMNIGISQIKEYFTGTPLQYKTSITVPVHNPSEFARIYDAMGELLDDVKGLKKVKEKLKSFKSVMPIKLSKGVALFFSS